MIAQLVRKAENAGFKAIALTLDTPRLGQREADIRNKYGIENYKDVNNVEKFMFLKIKNRLLCRNNCCVAMTQNVL